MNGKRFLAIVLSLCMLYGEVGSCTQVITHSITAQAASTNADCYSFDEATGVLTLKGKIDGDILREISKDALLIDLASKPGGVDFSLAKELGLNVVWALSLPGKCAPITSGEIIKNTITNILKEMEES